MYQLYQNQKRKYTVKNWHVLETCSSYFKLFCVVGLKKWVNGLTFLGVELSESYTIDYEAHYSLTVPAEHNEDKERKKWKMETFISI